MINEPGNTTVPTLSAEEIEKFANFLKKILRSEWELSKKQEDSIATDIPLSLKNTSSENRKKSHSKASEREKLEKLESQISSLTLQLKEKESGLKQKNQELIRVERKLNDIEDSNCELKEDLQVKTKNFELVIQKKEFDLERANYLNEQKNEELSKYEDELASCKGQILNLQNEVNFLTMQSQEKESGLMQKNQELIRLEEKLKNAEEINCELQGELQIKTKMFASNTQKMKLELERANELIKQKNDELSKYQGELQSCKGQILKLQNDNETLKLQAFPFNDVSKVYETYQQLDESIKTRLANYLVGTNLLTFIISGSRDSKIGNLWDTCKSIIQESRNEQKELKLIFDYFFQKIHGIEKETSKFLYQPTVGERFNQDKMISIHPDSYHGKVEEVLLNGYFTKFEENKAEYKNKAIVKIREVY